MRKVMGTTVNASHPPDIPPTPPYPTGGRVPLRVTLHRSNGSNLSFLFNNLQITSKTGRHFLRPPPRRTILDPFPPFLDGSGNEHQRRYEGSGNLPKISFRCGATGGRP